MIRVIKRTQLIDFSQVSMHFCGDNILALRDLKQARKGKEISLIQCKNFIYVIQELLEFYLHKLYQPVNEHFFYLFPGRLHRFSIMKILVLFIVAVTAVVAQDNCTSCFRNPAATPELLARQNILPICTDQDRITFSAMYLCYRQSECAPLWICQCPR